MTGSTDPRRQRAVRRYGASFALVAAALLLSRFVTPSGASSPLVLLAATAAVAYFGGRWPALAATLVAAVVNGWGIGSGDPPRLAVETAMILLLGTVLGFRVPRQDSPPVTPPEPIQGKAFAGEVEAGAAQGPASLDVEPLSDARQIETAAPAPSANLALRFHSQSQMKTAPSVIVIHGNAVLRLALRSTLSGLGYQVTDLPNAGSAVRTIAERAPAAVVFDVGRVDDPTFEVIEQIRSVAEKCLVVVLAGIDGDGERELLMAAGADVVLRKPVDTAAVAAVLRERAPLPEERQSRVGLGASP